MLFLNQRKKAVMTQDNSKKNQYRSVMRGHQIIGRTQLTLLSRDTYMHPNAMHRFNIIVMVENTERIGNQVATCPSICSTILNLGLKPISSPLSSFPRSRYLIALAFSTNRLINQVQLQPQPTGK